MTPGSLKPTTKYELAALKPFSTATVKFGLASNGGSIAVSFGIFAPVPAIPTSVIYGSRELPA